MNTPLITTSLISGKPVVKILDLGMHPYADTFIDRSQLGLTEPVLPLECYLCPESGGVQLGYISNDFERYNLYSYSYTSANSKFSRDHWDAYHKTMRERFGIEGKTVVEIGSNDGYLLQQFKNGNTVVGIDSSKTMSEVAAKQYGVTTVNDLFSSKSSQAIKAKYGAADLVIANNVFNHSNEPLDFAIGVRDLLADGGVFVFELPYWRDTIESKKFDQVYHEHVTYFTVKSSEYLLAKAGLEIFDVEVVDYHGGSLRVYAKRAAATPAAESEIVARMIAEETALGLFDPETYKTFQKEIMAKRDAFLSNLYAIRAAGHPIVAVGAAAKGNTFLNFYRLDHTVIDYVTDSSEFKQGKCTPLTRIPIVSDDIFAKYQDVYALILSWNISATLKENLLKINPNIKFL